MSSDGVFWNIPTPPVSAAEPKIYREYGKESIDKVRENPYRLADDIWGIGFKTADGIAEKMGYGKNNPRRCRSGIQYTLNQLADEGHVFAVETQLKEAAVKLLSADEGPVADAMSAMIEAEDIIRDGEAIYLPPFYYSETGTCRRLLAVMAVRQGELFGAEPDIGAIELNSGIQYDEIQADAIRTAVSSKVMVLTGGPQALNANSTGLSRSGYTFRLGDRVMQIRNNYEKDVFNGDIGFVESVNLEDRTLVINYDGREVGYEVSELDEVTLAYATTIHKAQGSEYPIVVIPVLMTHFVMLQRNLIYTGITRSKRICVLIGQKKALAYAVRNLTVSKRNTLLKERLCGRLPVQL